MNEPFERDTTPLPPYRGMSNTDTLIVVAYAVVGTVVWLITGGRKP